MDAAQFQQFMAALAQGLGGLAVPVQPAAQAQAQTPKISVRIPTYKGEPNENVMT